jgi:hypothetical protein
MTILLGLLLSMSPFAWHHSHFQATNAATTGAAIVLVTTIAGRLPRARFLNLAVGAWLVISSVAYAGASALTGWLHLLVGTAIVWICLLGDAEDAGSRPADATPRP